ncbi:unnamed protein product [Linum trigynum]|uniref:RNase H type-1 domain-containing protein n=1 Tax=Linum trigynum TaxID=586398 RepID=A0AAV2EIQ9_9ROSI
MGSIYVATFDGATHLGLLSTSAFVIKDSSGCLLSAQARQWEGVHDAMVLEALALRDVLLECQRRNLHSVSVAGDAKIIIDKCCARDFHHSKVGILLKEICSLLDELSNYSLRFIGRSNNSEAHSVARHALFMSPHMLRGSTSSLGYDVCRNPFGSSSDNVSFSVPDLGVLNGKKKISEEKLVFYEYKELLMVCIIAKLQSKSRGEGLMKFIITKYQGVSRRMILILLLSSGLM